MSDTNDSTLFDGVQPADLHMVAAVVIQNACLHTMGAAEAVAHLDLAQIDPERIIKALDAARENLRMAKEAVKVRQRANRLTIVKSNLTPQQFVDGFGNGDGR